MLPSMLKAQDSHSSLEWARDLPLLYTTPLNFGLHDHTWLGASLCLYKKNEQNYLFYSNERAISETRKKQMSTCRNKERVKKNELTDWD